MVLDTDFPYCCTGRILVNFGESTVAEGGDHTVYLESMKKEIQEQIRYYKQYGIAFLAATTNNEQVTANKVLTELGFKSSGFMSKDIHPETQVCLWWLPLKD